MLPCAVTPANIHPLHSNPDNRDILTMRLPFFVHTSKFRSLQPAFFLPVTDPPGVGSTQHQTLPKSEPASTNKFAQSPLSPIAYHPYSEQCFCRPAWPHSVGVTGHWSLEPNSSISNTYKKPWGGGPTAPRLIAHEVDCGFDNGHGFPASKRWADFLEYDAL